MRVHQVSLIKNLVLRESDSFHRVRAKDSDQPDPPAL